MTNRITEGLNRSQIDSDRRRFSEWEIRQVFQKAREVSLLDPAEYRLDAHGNTIRFSDHNCDGIYGWHIDHIIPLALGGTNSLSNLRPLHDIADVMGNRHVKTPELELAK